MNKLEIVFYALLYVDCSKEVNSDFAIYRSLYQFKAAYGVPCPYTPCNYHFFLVLTIFFFCTWTSFRILTATGCRIRCFLMVSLVHPHVLTLPRKLIKLLIKSQLLLQMVHLALIVHIVLQQQMNQTVKGAFLKLPLYTILPQIEFMTRLLGPWVNDNCACLKLCPGLISSFFLVFSV